MGEFWSWVICFYGGILVLAFLLLVFDRRTWRKQSWEGVVIGKYKICRGRDLPYEICVIEVCYDQTVQKIESGYVWRSIEIEIGDYIIKKSGSDSIEKRAIQEEEAREATHVLSRRLIYRDSEIRSRAADALGHIGDERAVQALAEALKDKKKKVRMNAAEALREIGTSEAMEAAEKWS